MERVLLKLSGQALSKNGTGLDGKKLHDISLEIKALKDQEHKIMEANRKSFESILKKKQKDELEKIKQENKKKDFKDKSLGEPKAQQPEK